MRASDYAWAGLFVFVNAWWLTYDYVLCPRYGWPTMTSQMRHYLHETVLGPFIFGLLVAIPAIFLYHIFQIFTQAKP